MENLNTSVIEHFFKLNATEDKKFGDFIKSQRGKHISAPQVAAKRAAETHGDEILHLLETNQISQAIYKLREFSYEEFLKEEAIFNGIILSEISRQFEAPKAMIGDLSDQLFKLNITLPDVFKEKLIDTFGQYAGQISPYIYALCLSNTQSRRSRAGKTFEGIIYHLYDYYKYNFDSQKKVGKAVFTQLNLGKIVDSILPGIEEFNQRRGKTIIGTMKTTLRERWQEVVEEVVRSNIPSIHLLTVDDDISANKATQMATHNIVLVVLDDVKQQSHLKSKHSVISFETYFLEELPSIFDYWKQQK